MQQGLSHEDDARVADDLGLAARLAQELNRARQLVPRDADAVGADGQAARPVSIPPAEPPSLFAAPPGQSVVAGMRAPEARGDLVAVLREVERRIAGTLGVPPALLGEGSHFATNADLMLFAFHRQT